MRSAIVLGIVWNTWGSLGRGPMMRCRCVGKRRYSCFHGHLSLISLGIFVVIITESFLSREEWWTITKAHARIVGSSIILTLSLENLFSHLPCLLCMNHCVPVNMQRTCLKHSLLSFNTYMVSFMMESYHSFSPALLDILAAAASFGLARSNSHCQRVLSVPRRACRAKR
jgi:hypothetical protein